MAADAIEEFEGGVVVISHDGELLDRICDHEQAEVWIVDNGSIARYDGGLLRCSHPCGRAGCRGLGVRATAALPCCLSARTLLLTCLVWICRLMLVAMDAAGMMDCFECVHASAHASLTCLRLFLVGAGDFREYKESLVSEIRAELDEDEKREVAAAAAAAAAAADGDAANDAAARRARRAARQAALQQQQQQEQQQQGQQSGGLGGTQL